MVCVAGLSSFYSLWETEAADPRHPGTSKTPTRAPRTAAWLRLLPIAILFHGELALAATCSSKTAKDIVIFLDVGHIARPPQPRCPLFITCPSGQPSARGETEFDYNLVLAKRISEELADTRFTSSNVMVTSGSDDLYGRADRASRMNTDIFLSIHHDGVDDHYLKPWIYQGVRNYYYDDSTGFSLHVSTINGGYPDSLTLARLLADQLLASGLHFNTIHEASNPVGAHKQYLDSTRGIYRRDDLPQLSRARMPAVLLEAGVIVNRDEELLIATPLYKTTIARAVVAAVQNFCNPAALTTYRVVDVAPNDVLNIRSGPNADLPIVGRIPPVGRGVRITGACSGKWCPIDYQGMRGWVNTQYLASDPGGN